MWQDGAGGATSHCPYESTVQNLFEMQEILMWLFLIERGEGWVCD